MPSPRTRRPALTSCTVIATRARDTGVRNADEATNVPNKIRSVTAAAAVSVVNA